MLLRQPIFDFQVWDAGKFGVIRGYEDQVQGAGVGGDQEVVGTDGFAARFEPVANGR